MRRPTAATPEGSSPNTTGHRPVLLHPLINCLQPHNGEVVVDGTLGAGGVSAAFIERVLPDGKLVAIDRDPAAVAAGRVRFAAYGPAVSIEHGNFSDLETILVRCGLRGVDVVTLDLGISSDQLDDPDRGFGFRFDGPLDMRMDPGAPGETAAAIVNSWSAEEIADLIHTFGEERFARRIAAIIVRERDQRPFTTAAELRRCVERAIPRRWWPKRIHPATKTFQALRIEVNHELDSLDQGLQAAISVLRPGGRLGVISFHSLEDTLVKNTINVAAKSCLCPPQQPVCTCVHRASLSLITRKAIKADDAEVALNPRARSARLRAALKLDPRKLDPRKLDPREFHPTG